MGGWAQGRRPLTLAILALGGEGGGVLSDWVVAAAEGAGYTAQNTSVAGVAQRTGATVYYAEMFPPDDDASGEPARARRVRSEPVMSLFPTPGEVDVVIASELMECGRAIQRGFTTPDRTTLITSTSRVYSIDEKMALGDGRVDDAQLLAAARDASQRLIAADFAQLAADADSVISASLLGALAGSGALPFTREQFEAPVRSFGRAVQPSLAAFAAGFDAAAGAHAADPPPDPAALDAPVDVTHWQGSSQTLEADKVSDERHRAQVADADPAALVGPALAPLAREVSALPRAARSMVLHGLVRTAVYQDLAYAERYLERVRRVAALEPDADGEARLTVEAARHVALWMCYQDTIHVALQKTRRARMERVRREAKARDGQLLQVHEFLHPRVEEITDTLPRPLGAVLRRSRTFARLVGPMTKSGMILDTTSVLGYTLLTTMTRARPLRPRSLRFAHEQAAIERWLARALRAGARDAALAREIVECQGVLKGYGATWAHGAESFEKLMDAADRLIASGDGGGDADGGGAGRRLASLREAALADEDGTALDAQLSGATGA